MPVINFERNNLLVISQVGANHKSILDQCNVVGAILDLVKVEDKCWSFEEAYRHPLSLVGNNEFRRGRRNLIVFLGVFGAAIVFKCRNNFEKLKTDPRIAIGQFEFVARESKTFGRRVVNVNNATNLVIVIGIFGVVEKVATSGNTGVEIFKVETFVDIILVVECRFDLLFR